MADVDMAQLRGLPSPYYRVAIKVLVQDDLGRVLVVQNQRGKWEIPGGGWEHDETLEDCVAREMHEELRAEVSNISEVEFVLRGYSKLYDVHAIRLVVRAVLQTDELVPSEDIVAYKFVNRHDFLHLEFVGSDAEFLNATADIWGD